jgi:dolichol-phosphate mannosyltransferase
LTNEGTDHKQTHHPPRTTDRIITRGTDLLSIIIPVYNEEATVAETVRRLRATALPLESELVVVDDGSTDSTPAVLESLAGPDLRLLRHSANLGKGRAIRTALDAARGDIVVIQDADLEYDPRDLPPLLEPILSDRADFVYGSRFLGECRDMKPVFLMGNKVLAVAASVLYGHRVSDEATCYKAFRTADLRSMDLRCEGFEFCPEVTAKAFRRGLRYREVPIRYVARGSSEGKKLSWRHGFQAIWTLIRYRFWK